MRKFMKKSILEIFQTMYDAHKNIKHFIEKKNYENAYIILEDCQNTAIQLGEAIESSEGEGFVTVSYLEEYCEMVYNVSTSICDGYNGSKAQKNLDKILIKAENSMKNDIKVKLEIVFLPYKSSMWDSLESVWKAADADPDCNAYVIPIPYYDRKPDGSFGKMHYEGDDFPEYVPITHYEAYNLELMKPDVIYIHNPYDEFNNVTSVDPRFYSHELKKYTDCLVYIPYYVVAGENVKEDLCRTSACVHADYVALQSKKLCEKYIKIYSKITNTPILELRKKFIPLGSPKFDAVKNARKEEFYLSDELRSLIGKRKIVMYNTSISAALTNTPLFIKKIRKTLEYFRNSTEYMLWWRPHPLLEATFKSMRPNHYDEYRNLVEVFKKEKIGIYDDTTELQRAIIISDIYYGDSNSSIAIIYSATGKPLVFANKETERITSFEQDMAEHFRDNSTFDVLKRNENYDGTAGIHIYNYIKGEIIK